MMNFRNLVPEKTLASKVRKVSFDPKDEGWFGSDLGENFQRKGTGRKVRGGALECQWETIQTYKLKDIEE